MANDSDARLVIIVLVVLGLLVFFPVLGMGAGMIGFGHMGGAFWDGGMMTGTTSGWMFLVGLVVQLVFFALLIGAGYLAYRALTESGESQDEALEELRRAYARGDLDDEEFERRRERLRRDT